MRLADLVETLGLKVKAAQGGLGNHVTGGYASDLLSDVIAHGREGDLWITLQTHVNIVAVASMKELAGIVLVSGREPDEDTLQKAEMEQIPIVVSGLPAYELIGRLYNLGVRGASAESAGKPREK